jgi:hypothetical protein
VVLDELLRTGLWQWQKLVAELWEECIEVAPGVPGCRTRHSVQGWRRCQICFFLLIREEAAFSSKKSNPNSGTDFSTTQKLGTSEQWLR